MDINYNRSCNRCGSTSVYFTKAKKICRACGYEEWRKDFISKVLELKEKSPKDIAKEIGIKERTILEFLKESEELQ